MDMSTPGESPNGLAVIEQWLALARSGQMPLPQLMQSADQLHKLGAADAAILLYQTWVRSTESPLRHVACFNWGAMLGELRRHAEFLDMQRAIARRVTERIPQDSLTLQREFTLSRSRWVLPAKATLVRFVLNTRREADSMAVLMRRPGGIDTLLARGDRAEVDYRETFYSSMGDSALVHRALAVGVGVLVGPEEYGGGWAVWQALSAEPGRDRTFAEARSLVLKDWLDRETGRRLALELQGMRRDRGVGRNEPAIARLLTSSRPR